MILRELFGVSIGICNGKIGLHSWAVKNDGILYCSNKGCEKEYDRYLRTGKDKQRNKK